MVAAMTVAVAGAVTWVLSASTAVLDQLGMLPLADVVR
jgi:hypothetical protein